MTSRSPGGGGATACRTTKMFGPGAPTLHTASTSISRSFGGSSRSAAVPGSETHVTWVVPSSAWTYDGGTSNASASNRAFSTTNGTRIVAPAELTTTAPSWANGYVRRSGIRAPSTSNVMTTRAESPADRLTLWGEKRAETPGGALPMPNV